MGLCDRLLVGHSVRPVGVGWVSEPGRRIVIKTVRRRQPVKLESDLGRTPTHTLTEPHDPISDALILAAGLVKQGMSRLDGDHVASARLGPSVDGRPGCTAWRPRRPGT